MPEPAPNVVLILADDLGYGDVSCLNPDSKIDTPRMDRIASEGVAFTEMHSNSAVCTPTRYGILTGRYAWRGALKQGVLMGYDDSLIEPDRLTLPRMLQRHGYRTACVGKWHLGLGWQRSGPNQRDIDFARPLTDGPHTLGFDDTFILPASLDMPPYCYVEHDRVLELPTRRTTNSDRPAFWREGPIAPGFSHERCLFDLVHRAEATIDHHFRRQPDQPLFLYFPTPSPHTPHVPAPAFGGSSRAGAYGDYVSEHDWAVGRIADALDRAGAADNTLLLVTSDNGAHMRGGGFDFERDFGHRSNHRFRGQKSDAWDGGHRVPFLARWPGIIRPGTRCDQLACLTDIMATLADTLGLRLPADAAEDSASLLPLLRGHADRPARDSVVHHSITGRFAIRDRRWKLIEGPGSGGWSAPDDKTPPDAPPMQLYDMQADPAETTNLYRPDSPEAARLLDLLNQTRDRPASVTR